MIDSICLSNDGEHEIRNTPQIVISNDMVTLTVLLPDAQQGYYRSCRFDWSGMIAYADFQGHRYFGPWKKTHEPQCNEDAIGPAEEFGMSGGLGFDEAQTGQGFLKIGVGVLLKDTDMDYGFWKDYTILKPAEWEISHRQDSIDFHQEIKTDRGWGYRYYKRVALAKRAASFMVLHTLTNIGTKTIDTTTYCHNFVTIDGTPIGPDYTLKFPFQVMPKVDEKWLCCTDGTVSFPEPLRIGKSYNAEFSGMGADPKFNDVTVKNLKTGAGLRIHGDQAVTKYHLFGTSKAICPEPTIHIHLQPGETMTWTNEYGFIVTPPSAGAQI